MLTKMWIGLYLSLLQVVLYIIVVVNHDTKQHYYYNNATTTCVEIRTNITNNDHIDNTYLWFIIPQLLNGLSSLLVSMTVFEFICAQAPLTTQGLLIGLWYATFSIRYLVLGVLDNLVIERRSWLISEGVKGFLILVSLVLISCVSRHYRYRKRDEIVNVQTMIEAVYERRLARQQEYLAQQEHKGLLTSNNSYDSLSCS